jgi:hypothetical protein
MLLTSLSYNLYLWRCDALRNSCCCRGSTYYENSLSFRFLNNLYLWRCDSFRSSCCCRGGTYYENSLCFRFFFGQQRNGNVGRHIHQLLHRATNNNIEVGTDVIPPKVTIRQHLDTTRSVHEIVTGEMRFGVRSIDPIENVEQSIDSSQSYEAANNHLHVSVLSKHYELRKECNTFQNDTESPYIFHPVTSSRNGSEKKTRPQYFNIVRGPVVLTGRVGRPGGFSVTHGIHDCTGR